MPATLRPPIAVGRPNARHRSIALIAIVLALAACQNELAPATPAIVPGASASPREVNLIARDYFFVPAVLELVPGETVVLHVVNGGLVAHEAVFGDASVQDAWEGAEASTVGAPPGPTPVVTVPAEVAGLRIVVASGQRVDLTWTIPADVAVSPASWVVGCHIPGHLAKGMQVRVRWIVDDSEPAESDSASIVP